MSDQTALGGRLPLGDPASRNPAQREIFDRMATKIVPSANDAQFHSTAADGRFIGPFNPALLNPAIAAPFLDLQFAEQVRFPLIDGYGLSEGTCAFTINPVDGERRAGTVGIAFPGQQIRVVDAGGAEVPTGVDGEVLIAGPNVMRGYLGRPDETARVIVDGWLHSGDIGHLDAQGYLTLVGRSKDMIIRGGENIYPKEIEDVLTGDPTVLDAADDKCPTTSGARPSLPMSNLDPAARSILKCCTHCAHANSPVTNAPPPSP